MARVQLEFNHDTVTRHVHNRIAGRHQLDTVQLNWTVTYAAYVHMLQRTPVAVEVVSLAVMCAVCRFYGPVRLLGAFE